MLLERQNHGRLLSAIPAVTIDGSLHLLRTVIPCARVDPIECDQGLFFESWTMVLGRSVGPFALGVDADHVTAILGSPDAVAAKEMFYSDCGMVLTFQHAVLVKIHAFVGRNSKVSHQPSPVQRSMLRGPLLPLSEAGRVCEIFGQPEYRLNVQDERVLELCYPTIGLVFHAVGKRGKVIGIDMLPKDAETNTASISFSTQTTVVSTF